MRRIINRIFSSGLRILAYIVPKESNLILFGAYMGNRFGDNSGALFEYCISKHREEFRYVWMTDKEWVADYVRSMGAEAYRKFSLRGVWSMLRASLLITSHGIDDVLLFPPINSGQKQIYLHHGIPLRGVKIHNGKGGLNSVDLFMKNVASITYMISTSDWGAKQQQSNIPVFSDCLKVTGYPRNDMVYQPTNSMLKQAISRYSLDGYVILYAPTWRKWVPTRFFPFDDFDLEQLAGFLRAHNMIVILRPHSVDTYRKQEEEFWESIRPFYDVIKPIGIDEFPDTQLLMYRADCLVTDYSSIVYDYLLFNRPVMFIPYDKEEFESKMGGFIGAYDELTPGQKIHTQAKFFEYLELFQQGDDPHRTQRQAFCDIAHTYKDGNSCARVYQLMCETLEKRI